MDRLILQVPIPRVLKQQAEVVSLDYGFSSLQELIRVLLNKLARRELTISVQETEEISHLSPVSVKRYKKAIKDIKKDRNIFKPKNSDEFFRMLKS